MKNYRLKKEAYPFFKETLATKVEDFKFWDDLKVNKNALEEVEDCFILYGNAQKQGFSVREMMDEIQQSVNNYYLGFNNLNDSDV